MERLTRVTEPTLEVLAELLGNPAPVWGLRLAKATGRPTGTVYPILSRLEELGWVEGDWEDAPDRHGPRRRLYRLTADGAALAAETIRARQRRPAAGATRAAAGATRAATAGGAA